MSEPLRNPIEPERDGPAPRPGFQEQHRQAARREHALQSLLEMSRELRVTLDLDETADLLLFNLMGQLGASRSALWMLPEGGDDAVLLRSHGFSRPMVEAVGTQWGKQLVARFRERPAPILAWALSRQLDSAAFELVRQAHIALFAPLQARDELLGWLAIGERVDASPYAPADLQVVETARGMAAVSMLNARLYNRARESNRALRAANAHLSELDQLKTEFLSNVNHELRTPLTVVLASLDFLATNVQNDPRTTKLIESSLRQAQHLDRLIQNLLHFSDAMNERLPIHVAPDDVRGLLDGCMADRYSGVTSGLRELALAPLADRPVACFDRPRVRQILDELIDNAVKFTPRGSRIELRASTDGGGWVRIDVADNGPGIPPEKMDSLFKSFEQVDGSSTRTVGGLGLGLALARKLAERMGCRLEAASEPGKGATFSLWLPAA